MCYIKRYDMLYVIVYNLKNLIISSVNMILIGISMWVSNSYI